MSVVSRLFGSNVSRANSDPKPSEGSAQAASPLAPAFLLDDHPQQTMRVRSSSSYLGKNFKACMMETRAIGVGRQPTFHGYGTHKPMDMQITQKLPNDRLDLIIGLNVSGHDLKTRPNRDQLLADRAKDNTYHVHVTDEHGRDEWIRDIPANGELYTLQALSIRDMKPGKTVVEAWPEGSAAVGGYVEGRRLEIDYKPRAAYGESGFDR